MVYDILLPLLNKHFFIVHTETFFEKYGQGQIKRFVAKHPKLKPELIVINNQALGFRAPKKRVQRLEDYPIYIEINTVCSEDTLNQNEIHSMELYTEILLSPDMNTSSLEKIAKQTKNSVKLDINTDLTNPDDKLLSIRSLISDMIDLECIEEDVFEGILTQSDCELFIENHLLNFLDTIEFIDTVIQTENTVDPIREMIKNIPYGNA